MYKRITLAVLVVVLVTGVLIINTSLRAAAKDWEKVKGLRLSSVVWSPDGKNLAFVAVSNDGEDYVEDEGATPGRASIWTVPVDTKPRTPKCVHTIKTDGGWGHGIPVGLFWATPGKLGWATDCCELYTINLKDHKIAQLQKLGIMLQQSRAHPEWTGPDDVYYDPTTEQVLLTGNCNSIAVLGDASNIISCRFDPKYNTAEILTLPKSIEYMATASCQTLEERILPDYYIAGTGSPNEDGMSIWHYSTRANELTKLASTRGYGSVFFPRPSPDGKRLAWIEYDAEHEKCNLTLFDIEKKTRKTLAPIPAERCWESVRPSLGCPFAWSPDGTRIAYTSGRRIELVTVK